MKDTIKAPDLKAPRYRYKVKNLINVEHFKKFKEQYPQYKDITIQEYRKIIETFNETFWENVIDNRDGCQLPEGLGYIFIGTCDPPLNQNVNYNKSVKYGKVLINNNWLTDGKLAKIFYSNSAEKYKFKNREYWGFIACRNFKRTVAKTFPENWTKYYRIDRFKKIYSIYKKDTRTNYLKNNTDKFSQSNTFDI